MPSLPIPSLLFEQVVIIFYSDQLSISKRGIIDSIRFFFFFFGDFFNANMVNYAGNWMSKGFSPLRCCLVACKWSCKLQLIWKLQLILYIATSIAEIEVAETWIIVFGLGVKSGDQRGKNFQILILLLFYIFKRFDKMPFITNTITICKE